VFQATIPALGYTTYFLQMSSSHFFEKSDASPNSISNKFLKVTYDPTSKLMTSITRLDTNQTVQISQNLFWYNASAGNNVQSNQASGAYIFRPNSSALFLFNSVGLPTISITTGSHVSEVRQVWSNWGIQTTRLYTTKAHLELEFTIGEIPIADGLGKEVITKFVSNLNTNNYWYTDSQGLELQQRLLNYRATWDFNQTEPVAGNYVPANVATLIKDSSKNLQLSLVTDRSCGVASLANGELEMMLHRRLLYDDSRGVGEPLNETTTIITRKILSLNSTLNTYQLRTESTKLNHPVIYAFGSPISSLSSWSSMTKNFSALNDTVPANIHIETLRTMPDGYVLLRLHHLFGVGEDKVFSSAASVDISSLFSEFVPVEIIEMNLSGNQPLNQVKRYSWNAGSSESSSFYEFSAPSSSFSERSVNASPYNIKLNPMQIRTFLVRFVPF
jgi:lysosomal alpha-mannosidase